MTWKSCAKVNTKFKNAYYDMLARLIRFLELYLWIVSKEVFFFLKNTIIGKSWYRKVKILILFHGYVKTIKKKKNYCTVIHTLRYEKVFKAFKTCSQVAQACLAIRNLKNRLHVLLRSIWTAFKIKNLLYLSLINSA